MQPFGGRGEHWFTQGLAVDNGTDKKVDATTYKSVSRNTSNNKMLVSEACEITFLFLKKDDEI